jgi:chromosome segregation ATPase
MSSFSSSWEMPAWKGKPKRKVVAQYLQVMGYSVPSLAADVALSQREIVADLRHIDVNSRYDSSFVHLSSKPAETCSAEELERMSNPGLRRVLEQLREHSRAERDAVGAKTRELARLQGEEWFLQSEVLKVDAQLKKTEASSAQVLSQFEHKTHYLAGLIGRCSDLITDMQNVFSTGLQIAHGLDMKDESVAETATLLKSRQVHVNMLAEVVRVLGAQGSTVAGVMDPAALEAVRAKVGEAERLFYSNKEALEKKLVEINELEQSLRARQAAYREKLRQLASARTKRRKLGNSIKNMEHQIEIFDSDDLADPARGGLSDTRRSLYEELLAIVNRRAAEAEACVAMVLGESTVLLEQLRALDAGSHAAVEAYVQKLHQKCAMEDELSTSREFTKRQELVQLRRRLAEDARQSKDSLQQTLDYLRRAAEDKKHSLSSVKRSARELRARVVALREDPMTKLPPAPAPAPGIKHKGKKKRKRGF